MMTTRRSFMQSSAAAAAALTSSTWSARAANAPGITDTEIKIGQTMPYSGPASAFGVMGRTHTAYFKMINEMGGVNGRRINLLSLDDAYSPPKTVEQTRRLVEQEQVACLFGSLGTPTNAAVRSYLNENKVPQLFVNSGSSIFADPEHFPWTISLNLNYQTEARIFGKEILRTMPDGKIGVLYQNDSLGKDYLIGLKDGLGAEHSGMVVKEASYEVSDPTVDSQVVTLQSAGFDVFVIAATPKASAQAIRKAFDLGWSPLRYISYVSASLAAVKAAGLEKSKGLISGFVTKEPTDARWKEDAGVKEYAAFIAKYMGPADFVDNYAAVSFGYAMTMVQVLRQCGDDLSRENIMKQATSLRDFKTPLLLPGIKMNTSSNNYRPIRQLQLATFTGENWELFGGLLEG
jgi:branched-chain amino acid transport system substrate-binding protein